MKRVKIVSKSDFSVSAEDLSLHLGGKGESQIVDHDSFLKSKDIKMALNNRWVSAVLLNTPIPIWPLSRIVTEKEITDSHLSVPLPSPSPPPEVVVQREEILELKKLNHNLMEMISLMKENNNIVNVHNSSSPTNNIQNTYHGNEKPVFIPKQVIPEANINMNEDSVTIDKDIDEGSKKLKNLRSKNRV
jgi:hypothetical protein